MPRKTSEARQAAVQPHPDSGSAGGNPGTAGDEQAGSWTTRYEAVVRSYLAQLVGPERSGPATRQALTDLAGLRIGPGETHPEASAVRKVVQRAGFDALEADIHALGHRIRIGPGRSKCAGVARRLRDRAEGRMSAAELGAFYRHTDRCDACAEIVGRFQASEWYLQSELGSMKLRDESRAPAAAGIDALLAAPLGSSSAAAGQPPPHGSSGSRPRRNLALVVAGMLVFGAIAFAALLTLKPSSVSDGGRTVTGGAATILPAADATGTPFVIAGARFAVFVNPVQRWTAFAKSISPGPGKRWLLVTVSVRNLTREDFDPAKVSYELIGSGGARYVPNLAYGTGPRVEQPARPIAPGTLAQAESAFEVPVAAGGLELTFDASGRHQQVVIPLAR